MGSKITIDCPTCGEKIEQYRNPVPTIDILVMQGENILLIERANEPYGWALPGGFVDYGESLDVAARRELLEETGIVVDDLTPIGAYSDPSRDPRQHTITFVFSAETVDQPTAGDDARNARWFPLNDLPSPLCFDHAEIIADFIASR